MCVMKSSLPHQVPKQDNLIPLCDSNLAVTNYNTRLKHGKYVSVYSSTDALTRSMNHLPTLYMLAILWSRILAYNNQKDPLQYLDLT